MRSVSRGDRDLGFFVLPESIESQSALWFQSLDREIGFFPPWGHPQLSCSCKVSIPDRGLWFFPPPMFQRLTVFSFQGAVAGVNYKTIISATSLSRGKIFNSPKANHSNHYSVCGNRLFRLNTSNPCCASDTAEKLDPLKKTPTGSRKFS